MIGTSFQHYRIVERIGAGGMGEVYRATDTRLGRDVAIKILPSSVSRDEDRMARFQREARTLAALNHPNIAAIYGLEEAGALRFLVLEFVPGNALVGPLPVEEALALLLQVAEALEASHEKGIVHRDLKPANIRVTPDGKVKVLDFGLAKTMEGSAYDSSQSPTLDAGETREGSILGTAAYMSPEQARGRTTDRRTDIWSFGCVLYEILTGQKAFAGETASDSVASILRSEPNWDALPPDTPPRIRDLLRRCLQKDPMLRKRDMGDARLEIAEALMDLAHPPEKAQPAAIAQPHRATSSAARWALAGLLALAAAGGAWWLRGWALPDATPARAPVAVHRVTEFVGMEQHPAVSPDGKSIAFVADANGYQQIWIRLLAGGAPLQVTRDPGHHLYPRWSPDSASLIYFVLSDAGETEGTLWEISALGGAPRRIGGSLGGADISHDGKKLAFFRFHEGQSELAVAGRDASNPQAVAKLPARLSHASPRWSPDDRWIGYQSGFGFGHDLFVVSAEGGEPRRLTHDAVWVAGFAWLRDSSGIVFSSIRGSIVLYLPVFNLWQASLEKQEPVQLTFGEISYQHPDLGLLGDLTASRLQRRFDIWKFPTGGSAQENTNRGVRITRQTGHVQTPSVAPDEREVVYLSDGGSHSNLWVMNLESGQVRQLTNEQDPTMAVGVPVWSPDGKYITHFRRARGAFQGEQWVVNADGTNARRIAKDGGWGAWTPDSKWIYWGSAAPGEPNRLHKGRVEGGASVVVREDDAQGPSLAADGTLYYARALAGVNAVSHYEVRAARPENGPSRLLARIPGSRVPTWQSFHPVLSPDGKWLAFPLTEGPTTDLWAMSASDGKLRQLTDFAGRSTFIARRVSWSPDSRWIYAAVGEGDADVVQLSGLIP